MTGITYLGIELNSKRLQLLKEALPAVTRVGALVPSNHPLRDRIVGQVEPVAASLGVKLQLLEVATGDPPEKIDQAFAAMVRERAEAVLGLQGPHFFKERKLALADVLNLLAWHEAHHQGQAHITLNLYKATHA